MKISIEEKKLAVFNLFPAAAGPIPVLLDIHVALLFVVVEYQISAKSLY